MRDVIVFAGTSEGRQLYEFCADRRISALFCVATEYGREVLDEYGVNLYDGSGERPDRQSIIRVGRLSKEGMTALFREEKPCIVIDATHPYAVEVTAQIRGAVQQYRREECIEERIYYRVLRDLSDLSVPNAETFENMEQALAYLNRTDGNILATTGSKEMEKLCKLDNYAKRVFLRILPNPDILQECLAQGFAASHIICMQGPHTEEMNRATLEQYKIQYLLTKQSGAAGGYPEKCRAAQSAGVKLVVVLPPEETEGLSVEGAGQMIARRIGRQERE